MATCQHTQTSPSVNKPKAYLGIDPGKSGSACLIIDGGEIIFMDWPKSDNLLEVWLVVRRWKSLYNISAILERVHAMPGQGVTSMFSFGKNFGRWEAFIVALGIPHILETPQKWMKGIGIVKSDGPTPKDRVKTVAGRLYPNLTGLYGKKGGYKDGRGDALLMAHYLKGLGV